MRIGNRDFNTELKTYVCGILNLTPDSFSDGGQFFCAKQEADGGATQSVDPVRTLDLALAQTERMIEEGADIIDIGGESTRPGYTPISDEEEIARVLPVIEAVKARFDIPVSLDTYKSAVAREGLAHGVDLINDIWGLKADPQMAPLIAEYGVPCCLMHNRKEPARGEDAVVDLWLKEIAESLRLAAAAGIARERIIIDPGIGFGKNYKQNLIALRHLDRLVALGYPVLLGASRKSVIAHALAEPQAAAPAVPMEDRVAATAVTTAFAVQAGCAFVRVHDVKENVQAIRMTRAILEG